MATVAGRPDLKLVPSSSPDTQPESTALRKVTKRTALGVLAAAAVVAPSPYLLKFKSAQEVPPTGEKTEETQPPTTMLKPGENPWETAKRDLAGAREGDPMPTDAQIQRGARILVERNRWITPEEAEPGRIKTMTPDEMASILDNRPGIEMTTPPPNTPDSAQH